MSYIEQHGYLCLQIVWHFSHSQMTVGVLGYPSLCFVAHGQARTQSALAEVWFKKECGHLS